MTPQGPEQGVGADRHGQPRGQTLSGAAAQGDADAMNKPIEAARAAGMGRDDLGAERFREGLPVAGWEQRSGNGAP